MKLTKIYGIKNEEDLIIYVGKTKNELYKRFEQHKNDSKHPEKADYLNKNKCVIILLHTCEQSETPYYEQYYIEQYGTKELFNRVNAYQKENRFGKGEKALKRAKSHLKNVSKNTEINNSEIWSEEEMNDFLKDC